MDIVAPLVIVVLILLPLFGLFCFISAIFNQWAYRNVMPIKDPRRRRRVLIITGIAFLMAPSLIILILMLILKPNNQF